LFIQPQVPIQVPRYDTGFPDLLHSNRTSSKTQVIDTSRVLSEAAPPLQKSPTTPSAPALWLPQHFFPTARDLHADYVLIKRQRFTVVFPIAAPKRHMM
jgi:hypothetical protein